jgi:hypothetical protein
MITTDKIRNNIRKGYGNFDKRVVRFRYSDHVECTVKTFMQEYNIAQLIEQFTNYSTGISDIKDSISETIFRYNFIDSYVRDYLFSIQFVRK